MEAALERNHEGHPEDGPTTRKSSRKSRGRAEEALGQELKKAGREPLEPGVAERPQTASVGPQVDVKPAPIANGGRNGAMGASSAPISSVNGNTKRHHHLTTATSTATNSIDSEVPKTLTRTRSNPFKLIACEKYGNGLDAPFRLEISVEAVAIIDVHAHCVQTEVIGLLGGRYCPLLSQLHVMTAEPCESLTDSTTDLQCEMDPVSQACASERLAKAGYHVVGWYHSHPWFVPNPSLRDLETQSKYQQLFAEGKQPFLAVILSPYSSSIQPTHKHTLVSKFKCLMVSDQPNSQGDYRVPFELTPVLVRKDKLMFNLTSKLKELCSRIEGKNSTFCLVDKIRGKDLLFHQKLSTSLKHFFDETGLSAKESDLLMDQIKCILLKHLSSKTPSGHSTRT